MHSFILHEKTRASHARTSLWHNSKGCQSARENLNLVQSSETLANVNGQMKVATSLNLALHIRSKVPPIFALLHGEQTSCIRELEPMFGWWIEKFFQFTLGSVSIRKEEKIQRQASQVLLCPMRRGQLQDSNAQPVVALVLERLVSSMLTMVNLISVANCFPSICRSSQESH